MVVAVSVEMRLSYAAMPTTDAGPACDPRIRTKRFPHNPEKFSVWRDDTFKGVLSRRNGRWYVSPPDPRNSAHVLPPTRWFTGQLQAVIHLVRPDRATDPGHAVKDVTDYVMARMNGPQPMAFEDAVAAALDSVMEAGDA